MNLTKKDFNILKLIRLPIQTQMKINCSSINFVNRCLIIFSKSMLLQKMEEQKDPTWINMFQTNAMGDRFQLTMANNYIESITSHINNVQG